MGVSSICSFATNASNRGDMRTMEMPSKLKVSLQATAKAAEALDSNELAALDSRVSVEVTKSPPELAADVITELLKLQWLPDLKSAEELRPRMEVAWQAYRRAEVSWRQSLEDGDPAAMKKKSDWLEECNRAREAEKAFERERAKERAAQQARAEKQASPSPIPGSPLYWKIDLPDVSKVLAQRGILPGNFVPVQSPHVTLLYLGGTGDDAEAAKRVGISVEQFQAISEALDALQGEDFEVKMTEIVITEDLAVAKVQLPPIIPCTNSEPHVTLGTLPNVAARLSNELLEDVKAGKKEGVTCISLPVPRPLKGRVALEYAEI